MSPEKWIELSESPGEPPEASGSGALALEADSPLTLTFRIRPGAEALEALLHARRSMLREERTLGRSAGEPSLEDAIFSPDTILWRALPGQRGACVRIISDLEARVERALTEFARP